MEIDLNKVSIRLDSSVNKISRVAAYHLSGVLENGMVLANNTQPTITIYKDRINFGKCLNPDLVGHSGHIMFQYFLEYGEIIYHFPDSLKCSFFSKTIEYNGVFAPDSPDNATLFKLIYPKFA